MRRPGLPRPWRWRLRRGGPDEDGSGPPRGVGAEEDARLLRRTRLRLMGVSALVTLLILVVLGAATYALVARELGDSDRTAFQNYIAAHPILRPTSQGPDPSDLGGAGANLFIIYIQPNGTVLPPRGQKIPVGLPNQASLKAASTSSTGITRQPSRLAISWCPAMSLRMR